MRFRPTAFAWIDLEVSNAPAWDHAQVQRLARSLGFVLLWPEPSLNALMRFTDIETVSPRLSFARWSFGRRLV